MASIKIKELPKKTLDGISGSDLMVIEDSDTKQITVQDLQLFFSSDLKLSALQQNIEKSIADLEMYIDNQIASLNKDDNDLQNKVSALYDDHERTKKRLGNLIEKIVDIENLLNSTVDKIESNEIAIVNLQEFTTELRSDLDNAIKSIDNINEEISNIKDKNDEQDLRFEVNEEIINEFRQEYKDKVEELEKTVIEDKISAKEYSDQLYDQIMEYIDFYHHIHEDPPNFDDPTQSDTQQMNIIYKVGTVYETILDDFEPSGNLPGTWEYLGSTNLYDINGALKMKKYTYVRVE